MTIPVIGFGAGGHARVLIEILQLNPKYHLTGLLDPDPNLVGRQVLGVPVLGGDELLAQIWQMGVNHFFVGVGGVGDNRPRQRLFQMALERGLQPVQVIHPGAIISPSAEIGTGCALLAAAIVNSGARLGMNVIVNSGAIVEHDCRIGDHVHIASGARLASTVTVGSGAHIGTGATLRQCVTIGAQAIVGAGAVVVKDVPPGITVVGVPARPLPPKETQV